MAVRTKRLATWIGGATINTPVTIFTVSSGETAIVRSVLAYWRTGTAGSVRIGVTLAGGGGTINLWQGEFTANNQSQQFEHWWVMQPGDVLFARHSVANGAFLYVSGAELEGTAD